MAGDKETALTIIYELERGNTAQHTDQYELATAYTALGDRNNAFRALEEAYADRVPSMIYTKVDPALDPLRSDPLFQAFLRRMNFPK